MGWKEPRTSLFLNDYSQLLPEAYYFVVVRNFNDTVNSLVNKEYKMQEEKDQQEEGPQNWSGNFLSENDGTAVAAGQRVLKTWSVITNRYCFIFPQPPERLVWSAVRSCCTAIRQYLQSLRSNGGSTCIIFFQSYFQAALYQQATHGWRVY